MAVHLTGIYRRGAEDAEKTQNIHRKDAKRAKKNIERKNPSRFSQERKLLPDFSVPDRGSVNPRLQKKYAFSLREKARMRGYESGRGALYDPLSPTLSLRERG
jgi:hypothetical protein